MMHEIDVYYWPTPNAHKVTIFLEEAAVPYRIIPINISTGEQFDPAFLKIAPNNKIPAIVDHTPRDQGVPISLFESGAILFYLSDKYKRFISEALRARTETMQWLFWQMAGLGPMAGQNHHFRNYADEKIPYAIDRYVNETARLYAVLNKHLKDRNYISDEYSIADMACYPWVVSHEKQGQNLDDFPYLKKWYLDIAARPAVIRAYEKGDAIKTGPTITDESKKILFGQNASTINRSEKE